MSDLLIVWSMWDGYLSDEHRVKKFYSDNDIDLKYVHTSGHASLDQLQSLAMALNPKRLIPIHTDMPDKFKDHFSNVVLAEDGEIIEI